MNKKYVKRLCVASYKGNTLDQKRVKKITSLLTRKELKEYINILKLIEKKKTVFVTLASKLQLNKSTFQKLFPNKKIVYNYDTSLIAGVQTINYDIVYNLNVKNELEKIEASINE